MGRTPLADRRRTEITPAVVAAVEEWLAAGGLPLRGSREMIRGLGVTRHVAWVIANDSEPRGWDQRCVPPATVVQIDALLAAGTPHRDICVYCGCSRGAVARRARRWYRA